MSKIKKQNDILKLKNISGKKCGLLLCSIKERYQLLRPLETIEANIKGLESDIVRMLREVTG
jgi:hypothetical protein